MGNKKENNKNIAPRAESRKPSADGTAVKNGSGTELFIKIFAAVALVAIIASVIIGVVLNKKSKYRVDYLNDELSQFVYISESDYKNVSVNIEKLDPVQDFDVENKILQLLCQHKDKEAKFEGIYLKNQTITVGDVVNLYYRGYTVDAEGKKVDFSGGCNFSSEAAALEIGSGQFVPLFELNLLGHKRPDYSTFKRIDSVGTIGAEDRVLVRYTRVLNDGTSKTEKYEVVDLSKGRAEVDGKLGTLFYDSIVGKQYGTKMEFNVETDNGVETMKNLMVYRTVSEGDLIQLNYSAYNYDGTVVQAQSKLIDLSDENLDEVWGKGFTDYFKKGIPVGIKSVNESGKADFFTTEVKEGEQNSYFDLTVQYVYEVGDNPLTVEAYFPVDYKSEDLQGVTAKFDVYIESVQVYDAPEYNDAFITEKLGLTAEDLAEFEGDGLVEKHRASIRAELDSEYDEAERGAVIEALWDLYLKKVQVKKLPENDVRDFYDTYYDDISTNYAYYSQSYDSIDKFAREYLGLSSNADWKAELMKFAEDAVKQKLVFYYIIRQENLMVPDDEYTVRREKMFNELFEDYLESMNFDREDFESEEKYKTELAAHRKTFEGRYDEDYYRENVIYEYAFDHLIEYVTINQTVDK